MTELSPAERRRRINQVKERLGSLSNNVLGIVHQYVRLSRMINLTESERGLLELITGTYDPALIDAALSEHLYPQQYD